MKLTARRTAYKLYFTQLVTAHTPDIMHYTCDSVLDDIFSFISSFSTNAVIRTISQTDVFIRG